MFKDNGFTTCCQKIGEALGLAPFSCTQLTSHHIDPNSFSVAMYYDVARQYLVKIIALQIHHKYKLIITNFTQFFLFSSFMIQQLNQPSYLVSWAQRKNLGCLVIGLAQLMSFGLSLQLYFWDTMPWTVEFPFQHCDLVSRTLHEQNCLRDQYFTSLFIRMNTIYLLQPLHLYLHVYNFIPQCSRYMCTLQNASVYIDLGITTFLHETILSVGITIS